MAGIGKYTKKSKGNRGFNMRSGNGPLSFKQMGSSPLEQNDSTKVIDGKTYPKSYTKKDVEFLKKQNEDIVRREDLDEKGKAIFDARDKKTKKKGIKDGIKNSVKAKELLKKRAETINKHIPSILESAIVGSLNTSDLGKVYKAIKNKK